MKKISLVLAGLFFSANLGAATLATFNGGEVTTDDLAPFLVQYQISDLDALPKEVRTEMIREVASKKLLAKEAIKNKYDQDAEFKKALEMTKENLLFQQYLIKKYNDIKLSNSEISTYYNAHLDDFKFPDAVKTKHILVKTEAEAKTIAKQLNGLKGDKLVAKFSELAKEKSLDKGSAVNGGDLPYVTAKDVVPEYFAGAKALKKLQVSAPIKSQFGYHIILNEDYKAVRQGTLEEAKSTIENILKTEQHKALIKAQAEKLLKESNLQIK